MNTPARDKELTYRYIISAQFTPKLTLNLVELPLKHYCFARKIIIFAHKYMIRNILIVALGGALGSVARYLLAKITDENAGTVFPFGTMLVNILGCLIIGIIYGLYDRTVMSSPNIKLFLTVGFCGGFTTFSTFMNESLRLFSSDRIVLGALYAGGSVFLGLIAVYSGIHLIKLL